MIMNVSGTVCQCIHYFPGKQWLAIDPTLPALKVNNTCGFDIIDQLISVDSHLVGYYKVLNIF